MLPLWRALWAYRGFILCSIQREFQVKYRNSLLGATWTILHPLATIMVYTIIFSEVMRSRMPGVENTFGYSIYLCAGVLTWGYFAEIVSRSLNVFLENANLLKKLNFPRLCLPAIIIGGSTLNFAIIFGLFLIFLLLSGNFPGLVFLATFPLLFLLILFAIGLGITLGVLNVFFRDVGHLFGIFLTFWFWMTPIVYPLGALNERIQKLLTLNPLVDIVVALQNIFVYGQWPQWTTLWPVSLSAVLLCSIGLRLFRHHAGEMVDEL